MKNSTYLQTVVLFFFKIVCTVTFLNTFWLFIYPFASQLPFFLAFGFNENEMLPLRQGLLIAFAFLCSICLISSILGFALKKSRVVFTVSFIIINLIDLIASLFVADIALKMLCSAVNIVLLIFGFASLFKKT